MSYRSSNRKVYSAKYHLIWCPKYRHRVPVGAVDGLETILAGVSGEVGAEIIEVEVMPDHVHLLVEIPPAVELSRCVPVGKGRSSRLLRTDFPKLRRLACPWSPSWFVSTVGVASLEVVRRDVEQQRTAA